MPKLVKISKRPNRTVDGVTYWKYAINLPNRLMKELDWEETTEVSLNVKGNKLIIEPE